MNRRYEEDSNMHSNTSVWSNATVTKLEIPKWAGVKHAVKTQLRMSFSTNEELHQYLNDNPQYVLNQKYGHTEPFQAELLERAYGFTENKAGYSVVTRWLTEEEVTEYLKDPKAI